MFYNYILLSSGIDLLFSEFFDAGVAHQPSNPPKHVKKFNDVVEIFHNARLKNSNSGMSSKHSKVGAKCEKKPYLVETKEDPKRIQKASILSPRDRGLEHVNLECQSQENKKNEENHYLQTLNYQSNSE